MPATTMKKMKVTTLSALPREKVWSGGRKKKLKASALTIEVKIAGAEPVPERAGQHAHQEHDADVVDVQETAESEGRRRAPPPTIARLAR